MWTLTRDAPVNRQRAEEGQQNQNDGRDGRECAGRKKRNAGLVAERRKIIHARQTHNLVPRMTAVIFLLAFERPFDIPEPAVE